MQPGGALPHSHVDDTRPRPVVTGTDIKVAQIASEHEHLGMTADEIVEARETDAADGLLARHRAGCRYQRKFEGSGALPRGTRRGHQR